MIITVWHGGAQRCRNVTKVGGGQNGFSETLVLLCGEPSPLTATFYAFFNSSRPEESIVVFSFVFREEMQILGKFSAQSWGGGQLPPLPLPFPRPAASNTGSSDDSLINKAPG